MDAPLRVLVCGGRAATDDTLLRVGAELGRLRDLTRAGMCVMSGGARGIDAEASRWCDAEAVPYMEFPAPWSSPLRRGAGVVRNGWMLQYGMPNLVLAFPGGAGTADMVARARKAGIRVRMVG